MLFAYTTELTNDEAYYYTYALHLQWNYFDHPPGVAVLINLTTLNLLFKNEIFIRLGAIICAAIGTWLSYKIGCVVRNERTGFYAAVLYNTSIYSGIIAGIFILPDSPQIIFWLAALFIMIKIITAYENNRHVIITHWILFGLLCGVCILCKVHGVFLWVGLGLYILLCNRKIFVRAGFYLALVITIIIISPIFLWNMHNHFITYTYHSNRIAIHHAIIHPGDFIQALIGQILYNNPVNVFLILKGILLLKNKQLFKPAVQKLLLLTGLPVIILVSLISLFNSVLPHWSGPGFMTLSFIAAAYLDASNNTVRMPAILKSSLLPIIFTVIIAITLISFCPGTIGSKKNDNYGSGDFTLDMSGWKDFANQYKHWMQQRGNNEIENLKIVCNKWFPAAHIEYYIAQPMQTRVIGVGSLNDLHNFAWLNKTQIDLKNGENALCIIPSNYNIDIDKIFGNTFSSITKLYVFTAKRNGKTTRFFSLYFLKNYIKNDEVHTLKFSFK